nr:rhodanese-like domain-containing protein [uncultured Cellulosilyticum sp.]
MFSFFRKDTSDSINIKDLDALVGKINLIDIRESYEFQGGSIKTAKNIPMGDLLETPERYLKKESKYYIMCQSGMRSSRTVSTLQKAGYDVINVQGGMGNYRGSNRI